MGHDMAITAKGKERVVEGGRMDNTGFMRVEELRQLDALVEPTLAG
jgi:hypothetical protein